MLLFGMYLLQSDGQATFSLQLLNLKSNIWIKCSQLSNKLLSCVNFFLKKVLWINAYFTAVDCIHYTFHSKKDDFKMSNPGFPVLS